MLDAVHHCYRNCSDFQRRMHDPDHSELNLPRYLFMHRLQVHLASLNCMHVYLRGVEVYVAFAK
jgi:hypothetical protein